MRLAFRVTNVCHRTWDVFQITNATMKCFGNILLEFDKIIENSYMTLIFAKVILLCSEARSTSNFPL